MCGIGAIINGNTGKLEAMMDKIEKRGEPSSFNENINLDDIALSCNRLRMRIILFLLFLMGKYIIIRHSNRTLF